MVTHFIVFWSSRQVICIINRGEDLEPSRFKNEIRNKHKQLTIEKSKIYVVWGLVKWIAFGKLQPMRAGNSVQRTGKVCVFSKKAKKKKIIGTVWKWLKCAEEK